jgi:hypothetical protein
MRRKHGGGYRDGLMAEIRFYPSPYQVLPTPEPERTSTADGGVSVRLVNPGRNLPGDVDGMGRANLYRGGQARGTTSPWNPEDRSSRRWR